MAEERTYTDSGTGTPIAENEQVKALLAFLKENDSPAYVDFAKLIESVTGMENRLSIAVGELEAMREDLQKMQDRSLKASLQKTCKTLEGNIASMQQKLSELKGKIVEGCRHILEDFKERGTIALNGLANFLHLKPALEAVRQGAENHQQASNRAMERIDAFVSEYHEAGKHLKNMCLALHRFLSHQRQAHIFQVFSCLMVLGNESVDPLHCPVTGLLVVFRPLADRL